MLSALDAYAKTSVPDLEQDTHAAAIETHAQIVTLLSISLFMTH